MIFDSVYSWRIVIQRGSTVIPVIWFIRILSRVTPFSHLSSGKVLRLSELARSEIYSKTTRPDFLMMMDPITLDMFHEILMVLYIIAVAVVIIMISSSSPSSSAVAVVIITVVIARRRRHHRRYDIISMWSSSSSPPLNR